MHAGYIGECKNINKTKVLSRVKKGLWMEFCERCGGIILLKEGKAVCAGCGYKSRKKPKIKISEKVDEGEQVAVIKKEDNIYPIVEIKCPQCKNKKAYFWTQQTRAGDESETKFYKCVKCDHAWRVYR